MRDEVTMESPVRSDGAHGRCGGNACAVVAVGIVKRFGATAVLDHIDLSVSPDDHIALVGANGAGKTTLIRCLLGEYKHEGALRVLGRDPRQDRVETLRRIGFVPQLPPPLRMPAGELVRFAASVGGADARRIVETAATLGLDLDAIADRPFVRLSGGQKQKLLIAVAFGRDVDLLILDEPAANLDPAARAAFFALAAARRDATMLISSHRLDEVAGFVNRVVEMDRGRIVLDDRIGCGGDLLSLFLNCRLGLVAPGSSLASALAAWSFVQDGTDMHWRGRIPAADRLRFLGLLTRHAAEVGFLHLEECASANEQEGAP